MRFSLALLASAFISKSVLAIVNENSWAWSRDGDLCHIPQGSFEKSCENITVNFCTDLKDIDTPCKFSADCYKNAAPYNLSKHNDIFLPRAVVFLDVANVNGSISHPVMDELVQQQLACKLECNPCIMPTGDYVNSCMHISIHYLDWSETSPCLMLADCDLAMRYDARKLRNVYPLHNEVLFAKGLNFSHVKNLNGRLIHPSAQFNVINDICFERGSTKMVAENSASINTPKGLATAALTAGALLLTL